MRFVFLLDGAVVERLPSPQQPSNQAFFPGLQPLTGACGWSIYNVPLSNEMPGFFLRWSSRIKSNVMIVIGKSVIVRCSVLSV